MRTPLKRSRNIPWKNVVKFHKVIAARDVLETPYNVIEKTKVSLCDGEEG